MVTNRFLKAFLGSNHPVYHGVVLLIAAYVAWKVRDLPRLSRRLRLAEKACAEGRALMDLAAENHGSLIGDEFTDLKNALSEHLETIQ